MLDNADKTPISTLVDFGLSEKEAKIYIALLELEVAKISEIAKKSGVNRSSAYMILEELRKKDLVSVSTGEGGIQRYVAASPEVVLQQAEDKENKQKDIKNKIVKIIPELKAHYNKFKPRPKVYIYTGDEALKRAYNDIFDEQILYGMKKYRVYQNLADIKDKLPKDFIENDAPSVKKSGAKMFIISPNNKNVTSVINEYKKFGSKDNFLTIPENKFNRTNKKLIPFSIYENKIEFLTKDLFLIVIESQEIADALKNIFDLAWEEAKRLNSKSK